ncbi:MAG: ABC transporter permease [Gemmatimonadaceae bacterium]
MDTILHDVRHALRAFRRSPGFVCIAVLCLAVGIGLNTASFTLIDSLAFRPLPGIVDQARVVSLHQGMTTPLGRSGPASLAYPDYLAYREGLRSVGEVAIAARQTVAVSVGAEPRVVPGEIVSGNFFSTLGTSPALGRFFAPEEDREPGAHPVVVASHRFWTRDLAADRAAVGRTLLVNGATYTLIGVAPPGFVGTQPSEMLDPEQGAPALWMPAMMTSLLLPPRTNGDLLTSLDAHWLRAILRLEDGVSLDRADVAANVVARRIATLHPVARRDAYATLSPLGAPPGSRRSEAFGMAALFMSVPLLVLLVACANLTNLLLARGTQRTRELAIRRSLGATRARLVRALLVESLLLATAGGTLGLLIAAGSSEIVRAVGLTMPLPIRVDGRVFAATALAVLVTAALVGLVPALRSTRADLSASLKDGAPAAGATRSRLRGALVIGQVAASLALLVACGLFVQSARNAVRIDSAVDADRLLFVELDLDFLGYGEPAGRAFYGRALERLRALPGVDAVGLAPFTPLASGPPQERVALAGERTAPERYVHIARVDGDFFAAAGIRARQGRALQAGDVTGGATAAVVTAGAAERFWKGERAIGQTLRIGDDSVARFAEVVGVVPDVLMRLGRDPDALIFLPRSDRYEPAATFYVRTRGDPAKLAAAVRHELRALDSRLPLIAVRTGSDVLGRELHPLRLLGSAMGVRGDRPPARRGRALRGTRVRRRAARARDRRPHGARRRPRPHPAARASPGGHDRRDRRADRRGGGVDDRVPAPLHALRPLPRRSRDLRDRGHRAPRHRAGREHHPRPPRHSGRASGGAALRVTRTLLPWRAALLIMNHDTIS